jgi:hypothetical protein
MCGWIRRRQRQRKRECSELARQNWLKSGALHGQQFCVHTQPFAFRAPEQDDESVKLSNTTHGRSSALSLALTAIRSRAGRFQNRQFLFDTNKSFSFTTNFSTYREQSTSFFLFNTNERLQITDRRPPITNIVARTGKIARATKGSL